MAKRKPRVMPTAGFYVMHGRGEYGILFNKGYKHCIYTTGIRGGGGHKAWRDFGNTTAGPKMIVPWGTLQWTCVPGAKELASEYDYYPTFNAIPKSCGIPQP